MGYAMLHEGFTEPLAMIFMTATLQPSSILVAVNMHAFRLCTICNAWARVDALEPPRAARSSESSIQADAPSLNMKLLGLVFVAEHPPN